MRRKIVNVTVLYVRFCSSYAPGNKVYFGSVDEERVGNRLGLTGVWFPVLNGRKM